MSIGLKINALLRLGLPNLVNVGLYRVGLKTGLHKVTKLKRDISGKTFFDSTPAPAKNVAAPKTWGDSSTFFGWYKAPLTDGLPSWHFNPFTNVEAENSTEQWWRLSDFTNAAGDIKAIWEPSRFDWVMAMAQKAAVGSEGELDRLNAWLENWTQQNPAFLGPNWKCGQEASIRVLHLALASRILGQDMAPSSDLIRLMEAHLARIHPTLSYAMAQDNNHGTSEAAALFVGGAMCESAGIQQGSQWSSEGRKWLENRVRELVASDGSFSQHSLNYHRVLLDTLSAAELWRRWHNLPPFSDSFLEGAQAATTWLYNMVDPETGEGPNVGDNDGANLLPLTDADYRDFRPSVQLAMALFYDLKAYSKEGYHNAMLDWLEVPRPLEPALPACSKQFPDGGYSILRKGSLVTMLKYPMYRFRPRHCDALHLDIWYKSRNILRDSGTYSYNAERTWQDYFPSTAAHNTVEFDGRDQMPAVGRFLRGAWLSATNVGFSADKEFASAGYTDFKGASHIRNVQLVEDGVTVEDEVSGFQSHAILRWRLEPGEWKMDGTVIRCNGITLNFSANVDIARMEIVEGWESRYYLKKSKLPVLEVELREPGIIKTIIALEAD